MKLNSRHKPDQYLMDYLQFLEDNISRHAENTRRKRYLIYKDGYIYTGTDVLSDVMKLINNGTGLYTYKVNKR